jgi:hypothetical protein
MMTDGRMKLIIDGEVIMLRRPKVKQLRKLYDMLTAIDAAQKETDGIKMQLQATEQVTAYWRAAVDMLGDKSLDTDDDELPVWLLSVDLIIKAEQHWRSVPYLSGGK